MSLVGSEVNVSIGNDGEHMLSSSSSPHLTIQQDVLSKDDVDDYDDDDDDDNVAVVPPSPPRAAERLFLNDLETQNISASALAEQICSSTKSSSSSSTNKSFQSNNGPSRHHRQNTGTLSIQTDQSGWVTAQGMSTTNTINDDNDSFYGCSSHISSTTTNVYPHSTLSSSTTDNRLSPTFSDTSSDDEITYEKLFQKDILSRKIRDLSEVEEDETYLDSDMTTPSTGMSNSSSSTTTHKFFPMDVPEHIDAAEKTYDTVKNVWSWGKGFVLFKPFMGLTEVVAGKVANIIGSDLESVDGIVVTKLHDIDDHMLNPAITAVLRIVMNAAGKTEDILSPIIQLALKPFIKDTAENPEMTPVPGVTVVAA